MQVELNRASAFQKCFHVNTRHGNNRILHRTHWNRQPVTYDLEIWVQGWIDGTSNWTCEVQLTICTSSVRLTTSLRLSHNDWLSAPQLKLPMLDYVSLVKGVSNLGAVRRERFLSIDNPLNPPGVEWVKQNVKVRVSICTCVPNLGAVRRERFLTIDNPLNPPGVGWVKFFLKVSVSICTCVPNLGAVCRERFLTIDNPLNPPGWGGSNF